MTTSYTPAAIVTAGLLIAAAIVWHGQTGRFVGLRFGDTIDRIDSRTGSIVPCTVIGTRSEGQHYICGEPAPGT